MLTLTRSGASAFASGSSTGSTSSPTAATCTTSVAICAALAGSIAPSTPESTENAITPAALMRCNTLSSAGSSDSSFAARVVARTPLLEAFERFFAETYRRKDVVSLRSSVAIPKIKPPPIDHPTPTSTRPRDRAPRPAPRSSPPRILSRARSSRTHPARVAPPVRCAIIQPIRSIEIKQSIARAMAVAPSRRVRAFARSLARVPLRSRTPLAGRSATSLRSRRAT